MERASKSPEAIQWEEAFDLVSRVHPKPARLIPDWVRSACVHGDGFKDSMLRSADPDVSQAYLFLYAKQSPQEIVFLMLERVDGGTPFHRHDYRYTPGIKCSIDECLPFEDDGSDIVVIPEITSVKHSRVVSSTRAVAFEDFAASCPRRATTNKTGSESFRAPRDLWEKHPLLQQLFPRDGRDDVPREPRSGVGGAGSSGSKCPAVVVGR